MSIRRAVFRADDLVQVDARGLHCCPVCLTRLDVTGPAVDPPRKAPKCGTCDVFMVPVSRG